MSMQLSPLTSRRSKSSATSSGRRRSTRVIKYGPLSAAPAISMSALPSRARRKPSRINWLASPMRTFTETYLRVVTRARPPRPYGKTRLRYFRPAVRGPQWDGGSLLVHAHERPELQMPSSALTGPRVLVADADAPTRVGLRLALAGDGFDIVAEARDAEEAVNSARELELDTAMVAASLPG